MSRRHLAYVGILNFLSGNLGDLEAGCGFKLSPNGVAMMRQTTKYPPQHCNERTGGPILSVPVAGINPTWNSGPHARPSFTAPAGTAPSRASPISTPRRAT